MPRIRFLVALLIMASLLRAEDESSTEAKPPAGSSAKRALNRVFRGRILKIKKKRVTIYYDFENPDQLEDFEEARPPRLLDASQNRVSIKGGRLVLEGSSAIRHKMEGRGELRARFYVNFSRQWNVGVVMTEPVLSDFYVVYTLFDQRFNRSGMMYIGACGLHEDEGAQDLSTGLVNFRDIFASSIRKKAKPGQWVEVEVAKNGWSEFFRVGDVSGKGSSRGKTKEMRTYQFGLFVHENNARFDDLTITFELTDEFLELNDLKAEVAQDWEEIPTSGPLAGVKGVPPRTRRAMDRYASGKGDARPLITAIGRPGLPKQVREVGARLLRERSDPKVVPLVIDLLYSADKTARTLAIGVIKSIVGNHFGYSPGASEKRRSKAIQKLNIFLAQNRDKYFG